MPLRGEWIVRHAITSGCILACVFGLIACSGTGPATDAAAPAQAVTVAAFGPAAPPNAPGQSLYLVRYQIAPGTRLRPHPTRVPRSGWSSPASSPTTC